RIIVDGGAPGQAFLDHGPAGAQRAPQDARPALVRPEAPAVLAREHRHGTVCVAVAIAEEGWHGHTSPCLVLPVSMTTTARLGLSGPAAGSCPRAGDCD